MTYVLVETFASKNQGRTIWFKAMSGIGPAGTADRSEAAEFETEDAAWQCPALWHPLSFYEIREFPAVTR